MDDDLIEELGYLRARAYGPSADIERDPCARRRLEELEALRRPVRLETEPDELPTDAAQIGESGGIDPATFGVPLREPETAAGPDEPDRTPDDAGAEETEPPSPDPLPRSRRRTRVLWIASLVGVAVVTAIATLSITLPLTPIASVASGGDVREVATLRVDPGFVWPAALGEAAGETHGFQDFYGLTAIHADGLWREANFDRCILILETASIVAESDFFPGVYLPGCGAGPFPATIEVLVGPEMPDELRERFPDGTALQFVHDGSRIAVFSDAE